MADKTPECLRRDWISPLIGSIAPCLDDLLFIKGEPHLVGGPLRGNRPSRIDVVDFFATWCTPCRHTMSRLSGFQDTYGDKITVVAITRETDHEKVRAYVDECADDIRFRVAIDVNLTAKEKLFRPAQRPYIPTAMIIINNLIAYVADPNWPQFAEALANAVEENCPPDA